MGNEPITPSSTYIDPALLDAVADFYEACAEPAILDPYGESIPPLAFLAYYYDPALQGDEAETEIAREILAMLIATDHMEQTESSAMNINHALIDLNLMTEEYELIDPIGTWARLYQLIELYEEIRQTGNN